MYGRIGGLGIELLGTCFDILAYNGICRCERLEMLESKKLAAST